MGYARSGSGAMRQDCRSLDEYRGCGDEIRQREPACITFNSGA